MSQHAPDTDELLRRLGCGDREAEQQLFARLLGISNENPQPERPRETNTVNTEP